MNFNATVIRDMDELDAIGPAWQQLSASIPENTDFFASWEYIQSYIKFYDPEQWCVITIHSTESQELEAVFPLKIFQLQHNERVFSACKALGASLLPYVEFPMRSLHRREVLSALLGNVLRQHMHIDLICFWPLHESSQNYLTLLEDLGQTPNLKTLRFPGNLSQIETRGMTFDAYARALPSISMANANYCERRLCKEGRVEFCVAEPEAPDGNLLAELCRLSSDKFQGVHAFRAHPEWPAFLNTLVQHLAPLGLAEISTLRLNGRVISSGLSFLYKRRRYFTLYAYEPEFARFSPSKILLGHLIKQSFAEQGVFCLGVGSYPYKRDWGTSVGDIKCAIVFLNPEVRPLLEDQLVAANMYRWFGG